jgi:hypothetical protein
MWAYKMRSFENISIFKKVFDIIIEGVLEITRDSNNGAIYNQVDEEQWNNNNSPLGTEWNSIYTQPNNGRDFRYNKIGNQFYGNNNIGNGFQTNQIGDYFINNVIRENFGYGYNEPQGNIIGNNFYNNIVGEYFYNNKISDNFKGNTIDNYFQWNIVDTSVTGTCLSTDILYDVTTVNVFKNKNSDYRLSYYDESDILTIETLTELPCLGLTALDIPENDLNFGLVINPTFTITSADFTNGAVFNTDNSAAIGNNGIDGFENTSPDNLYMAYYGQGLSVNLISQITEVYNNLGLATDNSTGYVWEATWGSGSSIQSGLVKFGFYDGVGYNFFDIQTIDPSDTDWETPNSVAGTSLVGTFLFPATFTAYLPLINKDGWC